MGSPAMWRKRTMKQGGMLLGVVLGLIVAPLIAAEQRSFRSIRAVNQLTRTEAERAYRVQLDGVVTYSDPEWGLLFFQDPTGAVYIDVHGSNTRIPPGTRLRVDAVTAPGDIEAKISEPQLRQTGRGPLPKPIPMSLAQLDSGARDSQYVATEGVLRAADRPLNRISFRIFDGNIWALVVIPEKETDAARRMAGALVRVRGVSGARLGADGKRLGSQLFVNSLDDVEVVQPAIANPFASPSEPISHISGSSADARFVCSVHVRGLVTWQMAGLLWIEDGSGTIAARSSLNEGVEVGDTTDVVGYPSRGEYGITLSDSQVNKVAGSAGDHAGPPVQLLPSQLLARSMTGKRVRIKARLIEQKASAKEDSFQLADGVFRFHAVIPKTSATEEVVSLPRDAVLEITGIPIVTPGTRATPASLLFLIESPSRIVVLKAAKWLTWRGVLGIVGGVGLAVTLTLLWITQLRRTVRRQTGTIRDRLEREMQLETQYRRLFERNLAAVFRWRPDGEILDCNLAFVNLLGFETREEVIGKSYWSFRLEQPDPSEGELLLAGEALSNRDASLWRRDGETVCLLENITLVETPDGKLYETTAIDVTQLRRNEADLQRARDAAVSQSLNDPLTGLPNRRHFAETLSREMRRAIEDGLMLAVLYLDLDGFKLVNDSLGHAMGDSLLIEVASRLKSQLRGQDVVARLGGDEFTIILSGLDGPAEASLVAGKLLSILSGVIWIDGHEIKIGASIGISLYPDHASTWEELLQQADSAMYAAKRDGRNRFMVFTAELGSFQRERINLERQLRGAIERGEIFVEYQPEFDLSSNELTRFEALVRWTHPTFGKVSPGKFIPIAEEGGLINALGAFVMEQACSEAVKWQSSSPHPIQVAVNVSQLQFRRESFVDEVMATLERTGLPPELLQIELTESAMLGDTTVETMRRLRAFGIVFAIDDFGTGYSCLSNLQTLPFDALKIDQSFVRGLDVNPGSEAMILTVISLAHNLGMRVIAEGVERQEQMQIIRKLGADDVQGYLTGRPTRNPMECILLAAGTGSSREQHLTACHALDHELAPTL